MITFSNTKPGVAGAEQKVKSIQQMALEASLHPIVAEQAEVLVHGVNWKDVRGCADRINKFCQQYVDYRPDPAGWVRRVEKTKAPWVMLAELERRSPHFTAGDCDDHAALAIGLLYTIGIPSGLKITWRDDNRSEEPNHIYALAWTGSRWIAMDGTDKSHAVGWEYPHRRELLYRTP